MANYLSPFSSRQFIDANGNPYSGAKLFTYVAGSSTKVTTYKDEAGSSAHANPIVLNTRGEPADGSAVTYPIWQISGAAVKYVLAPSTDTDPPGSPIATWDNIDGINDTSVTVDQWITGPTPTYVSATSFTLVGDQTSTFHVGRRIKTTNSGGTVYSTITVSAYGALTTITVVNDSGTLDSGLSAVSYGVVTSTNSSVPAIIPYLVNFTAGIGPSYIQNIGLTASVAAKALTIALKTKALADPSAGSPVEIAFRNRTLTTGDYVVRQITAASSIVIPSGATLGFAAAESGSVYVYACDNGTIREVGVCKANLFDEGYLYSTTAVSTAADSGSVLYTTTAMTDAAVRLIARVDIATGAVAGEWDNEDTRIYVGASHTAKGVPAAGYTRVTQNMCMKTTPSSSGASLTRDAITNIASPTAGVTALIIDIFSRANSGNGIATRYTTVNCYSDSGATIYLASVGCTTREEVAVVAGTILHETQQRIILPVASPYLQMVDDAGNQGYATYQVVGYFD